MNHEPSLLKQLKLWHIVVIGLGYMAPMAVFDTFGIVRWKLPQSVTLF